MRAALVRAFDAPPRYGTFADPVAGDDEFLVRVGAAALHPLVRAQANGSHYSSGGELPFVPGVDGVGRLEDGTRVYFFLPRRPYGSMAEIAVVPQATCLRVPDELDDFTAAALANPGMSSWAGLTRRARLVAGETVLVLGATGAAGRMAVQIAKNLGAGRVVAAGRDAATLESLPALGADACVSLEQSDDDLVKAFRREAVEPGVDVVLDYLWGRPAECLLRAIAERGLKHGAPRVRFVQVGSSAGRSIPLAAETLRSTGLELLGTGLGSLPLDGLLDAVQQLLDQFLPAGFRIETEVAPLADVEAAWTRSAGGRRLVFQP